MLEVQELPTTEAQGPFAPREATIQLLTNPSITVSKVTNEGLHKELGVSPKENNMYVGGVATIEKLFATLVTAQTIWQKSVNKAVRNPNGLVNKFLTRFAGEKDFDIPLEEVLETIVSDFQYGDATDKTIRQLFSGKEDSHIQTLSNNGENAVTALLMTDFTEDLNMEAYADVLFEEMKTNPKDSIISYSGGAIATQRMLIKVMEHNKKIDAGETGEKIPLPNKMVFIDGAAHLTEGNTKAMVATKQLLEQSDNETLGAVNSMMGDLQENSDFARKLRKDWETYFGEDDEEGLHQINFLWVAAQAELAGPIGHSSYNELNQRWLSNITEKIGIGKLGDIAQRLGFTDGGMFTTKAACGDMFSKEITKQMDATILNPTNHMGIGSHPDTLKVIQEWSDWVDTRTDKNDTTQKPNYIGTSYEPGLLQVEDIRPEPYMINAMLALLLKTHFNEKKRNRQQINPQPLS